MKSSRVLAFVPALALAFGSAVVVCLSPSAALAQGADGSRPPKVAVASPSRIFNEMQETKGLQAKMADDQKKFAATSQEKQAGLKQLQSQRDGLLPSHPQYEALNTQLMTETMTYKVWVESQRAIAEHVQKKQMKMLFEKIQAAIGEIAKRDNIDLVIADNKDPLPNDQELDAVNMQQLRAAILQKDVLFSTERLDISQQVLALLDARYKAAAGGASATVAPLVNPVGNK